MLLVYRVGVTIPTPGINTVALKDFISRFQQTLFGMIDMFTGGAMENFSIFSGICRTSAPPSSSSSSRWSFLTWNGFPRKGKPVARRLPSILGTGRVVTFTHSGDGDQHRSGQDREPGLHSRTVLVILSMITLTAGTAFIMWLGEQITERGIGNGISLIIFAGIVARTPSDLAIPFGL